MPESSFAVPNRPETSKNNPLGLIRAVDTVALLRMRNIRIGFYGLALLQDIMDRPENAAQREQILSRMERDVDQMGQVIGMLETGQPMGDVTSDISHWMSQIAQRKPQKLAATRQICAFNMDLLNAARAKNPDLASLITRHETQHRKNLSALVTELCEAFWLVYGQHHRTDLEQATTAATTLAGRLVRLEQIGQHVRLVSLNASVEAARAGDVGKGLMVIAQEFKVLAEEIQSLSNVARQDMQTLSW